MTRIIQLTDLHIVNQGDLAYGIVDTAAHLSGAVSFILTVLDKIGPVDGLVITGDLTDHGYAGEYQRLCELLLPLDLPLCVLPGNHDDREAMRAAFNDQPWDREQAKLNSHHHFGDVHVLALDSLVTGMPYGLLGADTLSWLDNKLRCLADEPVMIALHHPPFQTGIAHMDVQKLSNPDELLDLIASHNGAKITVCGHVHRYISSFHACGPIIIGPSVAHAVDLDFTADGPSQFNLEPGGFLLHSYDQKLGSFSSQFVAIGPHEGPYPFSV